MTPLGQPPHAELSLHRADNGDSATPLSFEAFTDTMATLAASVCVATASDGAERQGRTVTAVTSLSATPPTLLVSITRQSALEKLILRTGRFSLALLADDQREIGDVFAGKGAPENRFSHGNWAAWPSGQPLLEGAVTVIDCVVSARILLDTHCLFAGLIIASDVSARKPLIWHRRDYHTLAQGA